MPFTFNFWLLASNRTNCRHEGYEVSTGCYCEYWPSDPRHILPMFCQFVQAASRQSVPTIPTRIVKYCGFGPACFRLNINIRTSRFLVLAEWPSVLFKSSIDIINTQEHSRGNKHIIKKWKYIPLNIILKHTIFHLFHSKNGHNNQYSNRESFPPLPGQPLKVRTKNHRPSIQNGFPAGPRAIQVLPVLRVGAVGSCRGLRKKKVHLKPPSRLPNN